MAVAIDSGPVEATDLIRHVPESKWRELMLARRRFLEIKLSHDCRCLVQFVNDAKMMFKVLGFASVEHMISDGYGLKPEEISIAVEWLRLNPPAEPIGIEPVIQKALGQRKIGIHGGEAGPGRGKKTVGNTNRLSAGGSTRAYILARLDRDGHAELAAKVRAGTLSANKAAIEAGYRKQLTPLERIQKLWATLDESDRRRHLKWTLQQCAACGREGKWNGRSDDLLGGDWCDACCEEGMAASSQEASA
jgi:hypothetical protein